MAVVFSDDFTTATTEALETYDSAAWRWIAGADGGGDVQAEATNDHAEITSREAGVQNNGLYRCIDSNVPTGDQQVSADMELVGSSETGLCCRMDTGDAETGYIFTINSDGTAYIYRRVAGGDTELASGGSVSTGVTYSCVATAEGTGAQVDLTWEIDAQTPITATDTSGSRLTSGTPGLWLDHQGATAAANWLDNYSVDDLASGGTTVPPLAMHHYRRRRTA